MRTSPKTTLAAALVTAAAIAGVVAGSGSASRTVTDPPRNIVPPTIAGVHVGQTPDCQHRQLERHLADQLVLPVDPQRQRRRHADRRCDEPDVHADRRRRRPQPVRAGEGPE